MIEVQETNLSADQTQQGASQSNDGKEVGLDAGSSWKGMGVQVDTTVEIQNDKWTRVGSKLGQNQLAWIEGPETRAVRQ